MTFIAPHQRATSGGVYAIEQYATHMAELASVTLAVRRGPLRALPGVRLLELGELDARELPRADVLVYPADMRDATKVLELPPDRGRPVMLLQGYGTPASPVVSANLRRARDAVAIAHWLVADAAGHGVRCRYVPYGLDRVVFAQGPPAAERAPLVTVMTHSLDWKGLDDALNAVSLVTGARPQTLLTLFGASPVEGVGTFLASPSRARVGELLRSSAVHVLASWEEGFGMPGAEAIACGAALATTDTKGSRDYALHERTALVSPPRDPRALARNVLALLDDVALRTRLADAGQLHLRRLLPSWPEAGRLMAAALLDGALARA